MSQVYGNNKFDAQIRRFGGTSNKAEGTGLGKGKIEFTKAKEFKGFQRVCSEEGCFLAGSDSINQIIRPPFINGRPQDSVSVFWKRH